jgi:hypothetical protein
MSARSSAPATSASPSSPADAGLSGPFSFSRPDARVCHRQACWHQEPHLHPVRPWPASGWRGGVAATRPRGAGPSLAPVGNPGHIRYRIMCGITALSGIALRLEVSVIYSDSRRAGLPRRALPGQGLAHGRRCHSHAHLRAWLSQPRPSEGPAVTATPARCSHAGHTSRCHSMRHGSGGISGITFTSATCRKRQSRLLIGRRTGRSRRRHAD